MLAFPIHVLPIFSFDAVASSVPPLPITVKQEPHLADKTEQADITPQSVPAVQSQSQTFSAGPKVKRVSVGDTKIGSTVFYEHNMSSQIDRLNAIIANHETKMK